VAKNHRAYELYAHITWHTSHRAESLDQAAIADIKSAVRSASQKTGVHVLRGAVLADHIHLLVSFRPDSRLSDFMRLCKSVAAYRINRRVPRAVRWARGFYMRSVDAQGLGTVMRYVANQYARHPHLIPRAGVASSIFPPTRLPS
jgi:putative transposase